MIIVALGSIQRPKVEAVESAFAKMYPKEEIKIVTQKVSSGVSDQPRGLEETSKGAYNRAQNLIKNDIKADFYLGIEGGVWLNDLLGKDKFFLIGAIYITDGKTDSLSYGEAVELPNYAKVEIMDKNRELAPVAEEMFSKLNVRGTNGTVGELTNDLITRKQSFENGILMAMAKFYNKNLYN
jgi:inosine/xanthosine triphosphatase